MPSKQSYRGTEKNQEKNKNLPIADIFSIFHVNTNGEYFFPPGVFDASATPHYTINNEETFSEVVEMQRINMYNNSFNIADMVDYELAHLLLRHNGILTHDQPKIRNLGYTLQENPVEYTFVFNGTPTTYQIVNQRPINSMYRRTIFIDYDLWEVDHPTDQLRVQQGIDSLLASGRIIEVPTRPEVPVQLPQASNATQNTNVPQDPNFLCVDLPSHSSPTSWPGSSSR